MLLAAAALLPLLVSGVDQKVEVPFKIGYGAIIVDATVNGKKVSLMFDTGFGGCVLVGQHINLGKPTGKMGLRDFVGQFEADTVAVKTLKIGEKVIDPTDLEAVVTPDERNSEIYNTHVDGILGFGPMNRVIFEINTQNKKFIFYPDSEDISKRVPDNKKTFLVKMLPLGMNSVELQAKTPGGKYMTLALDTGNMFYATTHTDVLERVGLWKQGTKALFAKQSGVASGAVDSFSLQLKDMTIFGVPVPLSSWDIIELPSSSAEHDGTVGFEFLRNFNMTIDSKRRYVWLENWTGKVAEPPRGEPGLFIMFDPKNKRFRVLNVTPGGPADKAGIKRGDDVLGIDGQELKAMSIRELRTFLDGEPGSIIKMALSRNGVYTKYELKREVLVNQPQS
jgi:hypothetical protein